MIEKSPISSMRLGIDAYRKAQGKTHVSPSVRPQKFSKDLKTMPHTPARALKSEVLKSLHAQSNSGMVSMRDVAAALDHILKRSKT